MDSFERLIDHPTPIPSTLTGEKARARFHDEPNTRVLAIVDEHARPLGLLERNAFLLRMAAEHGPCAHRPVARLVEADPLIVDVHTPIQEVCREVIARRPSDPMGVFIVTRDGRYLGVGTGVSLLQALDVDAERRAAEAASTAERARTRFLDAVDQNIRTPLDGVLAMAELLERQPLAGDAHAQVRIIIESGETLLRSLSDALALSRAEDQALELAPEATPLRDLMDEVQALWLPLATRNGAGLSINYSGQPGLAAELDCGRLKQLFGNLIGNALNSTRRGGVEAGLEASQENGRVRLHGFVRDSGSGIDPSRLSEVFDGFASADRGSGAGRAGLELAMCRRILDAMGGRIWAENNAGAGAVFRFAFDAPLAKASAAETAAAQAQAAPVLSGHVLIVDDNATNRMVAQTLIEMFGCTAETAQDGIEAVEAVGRTHFDAILMDIRMPRMDGVDATRAIRALPGPERTTPIIALTANADPDDARRYIASGMACVVEKPIKSERLLTAMLEVLSGAPAQADVAAA